MEGLELAKANLAEMENTVAVLRKLLVGLEARIVEVRKAQEPLAGSPVEPFGGNYFEEDRCPECGMELKLVPAGRSRTGHRYMSGSGWSSRPRPGDRGSEER